jgi:hypothetical protein
MVAMVLADDPDTGEVVVCWGWDRTPTGSATSTPVPPEKCVSHVSASYPSTVFSTKMKRSRSASPSGIATADGSA